MMTRQFLTGFAPGAASPWAARKSFRCPNKNTMPQMAFLFFLLLGVGCSGTKPSEPAAPAPSPNGAGASPSSTPATVAQESTQPRPPLGKPIASLDAYLLWKEYGDNGAQAETKYGGKTIAVVGALVAMETKESHSLAGLQVVSLPQAPTKTELDAMPAREKEWYSRGYYPPNVLCSLDPAAKELFASIDKGSFVNVLGRCKGLKKDPDVFGGYVIILEDCQLAANDKNP